MEKRRKNNINKAIFHELRKVKPNRKLHMHYDEIANYDDHLKDNKKLILFWMKNSKYDYQDMMFYIYGNSSDNFIYNYIGNSYNSKYYNIHSTEFKRILRYWLKNII